jgi:hypothetical protein
VAVPPSDEDSVADPFASGLLVQAERRLVAVVSEKVSRRGHQKSGCILAASACSAHRIEVFGQASPRRVFDFASLVF